MKEKSLCKKKSRGSTWGDRKELACRRASLFPTKNVKI